MRPSHGTGVATGNSAEQIHGNRTEPEREFRKGGKELRTPGKGIPDFVAKVGPPEKEIEIFVICDQ